MEIGTELFAMTTTCSYALLKMEEMNEDETPKYLADVFCLASKRRIENLFDEISDNDDDKSVKLAKSILAGDLKWMEEGVSHTPSMGNTPE